MKNILKITAVAMCLAVASNGFAQTTKKQEPTKKPAAKTEAKKSDTASGKQKMAITEQGVNKNNKKKTGSANAAATTTTPPPAGEQKK